jgi:hypothetical protein
MQLRAYPLMSTRSKRAISRKVGRFGRPTKYSPRLQLILKVATKLGISKSSAYALLMQEREYFLKEK